MCADFGQRTFYFPFVATAFKMRGESKVKKTLLNAALYTLVSFVSNFIAAYLAQVWIDGIHQLMQGFITEVSVEYRNVLYLLFYLAGFIIPFLSLKKLLEKRMHTVAEDGRRQGWIKNALLIMLPGETIRFALCFSVLGNFEKGGFFAVIPTVLFDTYWLDWTNRYAAVRAMGQFGFLDLLGYFICYLVYLLPLLFALALCFKNLFYLEKAEYEDHRFLLSNTETQ